MKSRTIICLRVTCIAVATSVSFGVVYFMFGLFGSFAFLLAAAALLTAMLSMWLAGSFVDRATMGLASVAGGLVGSLSAQQVVAWNWLVPGLGVTRPLLPPNGVTITAPWWVPGFGVTSQEAFAYCGAILGASCWVIVICTSRKRIERTGLYLKIAALWASFFVLLSLVGIFVTLVTNWNGSSTAQADAWASYRSGIPSMFAIVFIVCIPYLTAWVVEKAGSSTETMNGNGGVARVK